MANFISIYPPKEKSNQKRKRIYSEEFQEMLDSLDKEDYAEELHVISEKKRRLSYQQVKALEKNFEAENKLEPERKVKLAEEIGLNPRQVAVWFQNRRARSKTKQLEKEYGVLEANYGALKLDYDNLEKEKEILSKQLKELKSKICKGNECAKENLKEQSKCEDSYDGEFMSCSSSKVSGNRFQLCDLRGISGKLDENPLIKIEDQSYFGLEESCNFFSVDHAPNLHWCIAEE